MRVLFQDRRLGDEQVDLRVGGGPITALARLGHDAPLAPEVGDEIVHGGRITPPMGEPHRRRSTRTGQ